MPTKRRRKAKALPPKAGAGTFRLIPDGWSRESWLRRLRNMAEICIDPARAAELSAWADKVEAMPQERVT